MNEKFMRLMIQLARVSASSGKTYRRIELHELMPFASTFTLPVSGTNKTYIKEFENHKVLVKKKMENF